MPATKQSQLAPPKDQKKVLIPQQTSGSTTKKQADAPSKNQKARSLSLEKTKPTILQSSGNDKNLSGNKKAAEQNKALVQKSDERVNKHMSTLRDTLGPTIQHEMKETVFNLLAIPLY